MRSLRWLLLVAILALVAAVFITYRTQRKVALAGARATPPSIPVGTTGTAIQWEWAQSDSGKPTVHVYARNSRQTDNNQNELQDLELRIYMKDAKHYDRIRAPLAQFSTVEKKLYAPGEAEITLDVPVEGQPPHPLTSIKAAGVNFDSVTGHAVTDKHVTFSFDGGAGVCDGATYDPDTHELALHENVVINMQGKDPKSFPMKVEAGDLRYNEKEAMIYLGRWSRLTRDQTIINAGPALVKLKNNELKQKKLDTVDAPNATGTDKRPGREIEYSAGMLHVQYTPEGLMEKMNGTGNAKLVSHGNGSVTTMTGNAVDLFFNTQSGDSELSSALARGNGSLESVPISNPNGETADTKMLRSDAFDVFMKPGGRDLERVVTHSPGTLEFMPNQIARHRRILKSSDMDIRYGQKSEIQSFHATAASTETYPSEDDKRKKKPNEAVAYTSSKTLDATFDDKAQLKLMKQNGDFHYTEGGRKAQSENATLENDRNVMDLENHARISDENGTTEGDHIQLQQATGDFDARGHVATTRLPDAQKSTSEMLDKDEPTQGMADHVISANRNHLIHYIGNAVVWQSSNRVQADRIDIDRDQKGLVADGQVVSQFQDKKKAESEQDAGSAANKIVSDQTTKTTKSGGKTNAAVPVFTVVKAPHMVYTDADRQALYTGGTNFWRSGMTVKSNTLKAFLNDNNSDAESRINHAFGDGAVEIIQASNDRQRIGHSDHAEYYAEEGKIVLTGADPQVKDTLRGNTTKGTVLTYFTDDDRLIVTAAPKTAVRTEVHKKKH